MNEIIDALRIEVPREIERRVPTKVARAANRGRCVQATHVGLDALRYFGVEARPLATLMLAGNDAWTEWMVTGGETPMPDEAWSIGIDPNAEGRGYPAHLVIEIDGQLLDLDAGFYSRPHRGFVIPPSVMTPIRPRIEDGPIAGIDLDGGGVMIYGQAPLDTPNFRGSGAWKNTGTWAGPVIRRMRARLDWQRESNGVALSNAELNLRHHGRID